MPVTIRNYGAEDLAACRALWVELTAWYRQIFGAPQIGGIDLGSKVYEHLALSATLVPRGVPSAPSMVWLSV